MSIFASIDDELTSELSEDYAAIFQSIRDLTKLLDIDSYAEMGDQHEHAGQLLKTEDELAKKLRHQLSAQLKDEPDPDIIVSFLKAYRLEELYPETVGPIQETLSTLPLLTLPKFHARTLDPLVRAAAFESLCETFSVSPAHKNEIELAYETAKQSLQSRRRFVDQLRVLFTNQQGSVVEPTLLKRQFDRWFPANPLRESEIGIVLTRTCLYWCMPTLDEIETRETEADREAVKAWLKLTGRFSFQYFSHFPTFSSFDARDANPELIEELAGSLDLSESDVIHNLNSTTTIERTKEIEKYLIHDTWGHTWQGDLTRLGQLYDTMESLKSPVDANEHLELPDGNILSMLDLMYLTMRGTIRFDAELAERYVDEWIRLRLQALLAPIMAELTADCVEYKFAIDNSGESESLPSSSLFSENPAKLDFAWVDIGYFVRSLRRTIETYTKNDELKTSLIDRICLLLKSKYPRQFRKIESAEALRSEVEGTVTKFVNIFLERQEQHLNQDLILPDDGEPNSFSLLFTNFLRVQFTLNHLIQVAIEKERPEKKELFNVLILFVALHFEKNPMQCFWNLDETLAEYALPVLAEMRAAENQ